MKSNPSWILILTKKEEENDLPKVLNTTDSQEKE